MNRNSEAHFSVNPQVDVGRSKFDRSFTHKTTFNSADLIPIYVDTTIMPGDSVTMDMSEVVRMATPITPVMDNANLDIYFFFVPYRLIWDHWRQFMGENDTAPWTQTIQYTIPQVKNNGSLSDQRFKKGSVADYMGYPTEISTVYHASILPFRAYCLVWNEFFRDENLENPVSIDRAVDSTVNVIGYNHTGYNDVQHAAKGGGKPLKACKYFDYFTSCLPQAQKGTAVQVPLGAMAPVRIGEPSVDLTTTYTKATNMYDKHLNIIRQSDSTDAERQWNFKGDGTENFAQNTYAGVYADLSNAIGATVNQLRQAFAVQKFYEKQALGGSRYIEYIKTHFGVTNPDFRLQRPEYLGGKRIPITMNQVIQSTPTDGTTTPLGTTGAFSVTADSDDMFTHSFTEHGILLGLATVRTVHTYQQGLNRMFSKKSNLDWYIPVFANLGNQAVLNKEIYLQGDSVVDTDGNIIDEQAFGYQEAWACERYMPDIVTGEMRSNYAQSLDIWHYADYYTQLPKLGDKWIQETPDNIARTLAVQTQDQFIADFYFKAIYTRPMPLYSIPGLIDHH